MEGREGERGTVVKCRHVTSMRGSIAWWIMYVRAVKWHTTASFLVVISPLLARYGNGTCTLKETKCALSNYSTLIKQFLLKLCMTTF